MFETRLADLEALARAQGLDFFPVSFEMVPHDIMTEVAAYGLPTRARHWSYGKVYQHQHLYGTMGLSKIYEIVLNSDPGLAFLLDSNEEIVNLLVAAHVFGHVDFFKNNLCFADSNRNMVNDAMAHAVRIDRYIERYGLEAVEHLMDIGLALDRHIDPHQRLQRQPYAPRRVVEKAHPTLPYDDLLDTPTRSVSYVVEGQRLPPHPEHDLLWFLSTYAPLEDWQRDVLQIIREESYYFYPQFLTKILNEGWASYWHAELFHLYEGVAPQEMLEFARLHAGVVNPGGRYALNPYYLGYTMLVDIEQRWNAMHAAGESQLTGRQKLFEVRQSEDDLSFLRNYLTPELVERLQLFAYGRTCSHYSAIANPFLLDPLQLFAYGRTCSHPPGQPCHQCDTVVITARERDAVVDALLGPRYNYGAPRLVIQEVTNGALCLEHLDRHSTFLDRPYATNTLAYMAELWQQPVHLLTSDEHGGDTTLSARP